MAIRRIGVATRGRSISGRDESAHKLGWGMFRSPLPSTTYNFNDLLPRHHESNTYVALMLLVALTQLALSKPHLQLGIAALYDILNAFTEALHPNMPRSSIPQTHHARDKLHCKAPSANICPLLIRMDPLPSICSNSLS